METKAPPTLKALLDSASKVYFHMEPFCIQLPTSTVPVYGYVSGGWSHEEDTEMRVLLDIAPDPVLHPRNIVLKALAQACPKWAVGRCNIVSWGNEQKYPDREKVLESLSVKSVMNVMTPDKLLDY